MIIDLPKVPRPAEPDYPLSADTQMEELRVWCSQMRERVMEILNQFDRDLQRKDQPVELPIATAADVIAGVKYRPVQPGRQIYVEDEAGGAVTAFADGVDWRRSTDRAVVS